MGEMRYAYDALAGEYQGRDQMEDLGVGGRITLT
jgi:hypothetical protein